MAAVLDAGLDMFLQRGFHQSSIHDITAAAGLTRGAFYSNFPTKEALFLAVYDRKTDEILTEYHRILEGTPAGEDPVTRLLNSAVGVSGGVGTDNWFLVLAEFTVHAARNPDVSAEFSIHRTRFISRLADLLARIVTAAGREVDTEIVELATAVLALHDGMALVSIIRPPGDRADALFKQIAAVIIDTLTRSTNRS